jgi:cathepsin B
MLRVVFVAAAIGLCVAVPASKVSHHILSDQDIVSSQELVDHVNSRRTTWTAGHNDKFVEMTVGQAKNLMGTRLDGPMPPAIELEYDVEDVPSAFDAREKWPQCPSVMLVRDQSACGSCWAFGSTESFNDRLCIATGNKDILSATDVLGCCEWTCGNGCNGGYPQMAWSYFHRTGIVTDSCYPYPFPACAHHVDSKTYPACPSSDYRTPSCNRTCADGTTFSSDKVKAASSYSINSEQDIMREISTKGPVTAAFTVFADFVTYKSGVYQHTTGQELGGHAIEIVGYGEDDGVKYWTVKNSWNPSWGSDGYFNILRGQDECGIESSVVAGDAQ